MSYYEEMLTYLDEDGLMGTTPNPTKWSSGNAILDTATACALYSTMFSNRGVVNAPFFTTLVKCEAKPGVYNKNPGRQGQITHDDMIGSAYSALSAFRTVAYAEENNWVLSNTGEFYWDALVRPWHKTYYLMAAGRQVGLTRKLWLIGMILVDAYFNNTDNSSEKKLTWLMTKVVVGRSKLIDFAISIWQKRLKKTWGSMKNVFTVYYGKDHLFSRYCNE